MRINNLVLVLLLVWHAIQAKNLRNDGSSDSICHLKIHWEYGYYWQKGAKSCNTKKYGACWSELTRR